MSNSKKRKWENSLSRKLAQVLRHGNSIGKDGYLTIEELLEVDTFRRYNEVHGFNIDVLRRIVSTNSKQRFSLVEEGGECKVRANQGHNSDSEISTEQLLTEITDAQDIPVVIHGTTFEAYSMIERSGMLKSMGRKHLHFTTALPQDGGVVSGMRTSAQDAIYLNVVDAMASNIKFYRSDNGVILTEVDVPACYFKKVEKIYE